MYIDLVDHVGLEAFVSGFVFGVGRNFVLDCYCCYYCCRSLLGVDVVG